MDFSKYKDSLGERMGLIGRLKVAHLDRNGNVVEEFDIPNVACNAGKAQVAAYISGIVPNTTNMFKYLAIGTGTTPAASTDTALGAEVGSRVAGSTSRYTTVYTNDTSRIQGTFTFNAATAITEYGLFDASTGGTLLAHQVYGTMSMSSGDSLAVTWDVRLT